MRLHRLSVFTGIFILILAQMACTMNIGGPAYPSTTVPVSPEAMGDLTSALETALANGSETGQVTLKITELQLTSYLACKLLAQPQPFITKPQVYLQNSMLQVYGTATQGYFQTTMSMVFRAGVDEQGRLIIQLTSANFGPLPVPNGLINFATASV
jgi:hypothetical protein